MTAFLRRLPVVIAGSLLGMLAACGGNSGDPAVAVPDALAGNVVDSTTNTTSAATHDERDCLWVLNSKINTLFPDRNADYWVAALVIPPGGAVHIDGQFPHSRYISFNLYDETLAPIDALTDVEMQPQPGSTNPFVTGADRNAVARDYQLKLIAAVAPTDATQRAPNTLYSSQSVGPLTVTFNLAIVFYRVYVTDSGAAATTLPHISFELPGGKTINGPTICSALDKLSFAIPDLAKVPDPIADLPVNTAAFSNLLWLKFLSLQASQANRVYATPLGPLAYELVGSATTGNGGFGSNRDNRYIYAAISQRLGDVVAIHARFPQAPKTSDGRSPVPSGQMRYWSLCSNDNNTVVVFDCLYDEQVARDAKGRGVILVSKPEDRPSNATTACGVSWMDWGSADNALLLYRNMLPLPEAQFPYAVQYVPSPPGQYEAQTMGPYFPYGTHMARADFEKLGCPVSADQLPEVVTPPP
jgi:hypothetical protein